MLIDFNYFSNKDIIDWVTVKNEIENYLFEKELKQ